MYLNMFLKFRTYPIRNSYFDLAEMRVNGKKVEIAVKQIVSGRIVQVSGTVGNPESLQEYKQFVEVEKVEREKILKAKL